MTTANKLQSAYIKLYTYMRRYIWEFEIVKLLANLEVSVYQTFPDIETVRNQLGKLKRDVLYSDVVQDDECLKDAFNDFEAVLDEDTELYASLKTFKEVIVV